MNLERESTDVALGLDVGKTDHLAVTKDRA